MVLCCFLILYATAEPQVVFFIQLGGKNAAIIFEDSDLDKCVPGCVR